LMPHIFVGRYKHVEPGDFGRIEQFAIAQAVPFSCAAVLTVWPAKN
jgi:hypothetical protein